MTETSTSNKFEFKAETRQLLDILIHSLYSSREIFIRELVSNASDALEKLRFESIKGTAIRDNDLPLEIKISLNETDNTLTISDTGIGMTMAELSKNIGTIAKSSSAEFIEQLKENKSDANSIIGRFGVGFYSVFMAAKEVIIRSQSYKTDALPAEWRSEGTGEYELTELNGTEMKRGTEILIKLKDDAKDFASKARVENIIKSHSAFVSFPIYIENERVNTLPAVWREPKSKVTPEQYKEFYTSIAHDFDEPLDTLHIAVDAPIQYSALMFIPKRANDFFGIKREEYGLDLYVRRVLIKHQMKELLPEYLSFVKGVVESEDLPLNVSRETLQENPFFAKIASNIHTQILSHLGKMAKEDPGKYETLWKEHGKYIKLGYTDYAHRDKVNELLRFNSSFDTEKDALVSLDDYVSRAKEGQKEIYFISGPTKASILANPHLELFANKGIEVLFLSDPIDEFVLTSIAKFKEFDFKSIDSIDLSALDKFESVKTREAAPELNEEEKKDFDALLVKMKEWLGDKVKDVKSSKRLLDSPVCVTDDNSAYSASFMKMMKLAQKDFSVEPKVFEVNPDHPLIRSLLLVFKQDNNDEFVKEISEGLLENALLIEGSLTEPHKLVGLFNKTMTKAAEMYARQIRQN